MSLTYARDGFSSITYKILEPSIGHSSNNYYEYREEYLKYRNTVSFNTGYQVATKGGLTQIFCPLAVSSITSKTGTNTTRTTVFSPGIGIGLEFKYFLLRVGVNYPVPDKLTHVDDDISIAPFYAFQFGIKYDFGQLFTEKYQ